MRIAARAFTLIELLVVVAIIAILIAILLPSLSRAKEATKRTVCAAHLKAQGSAVAIYAQQFADYVPYFNNPNPSRPLDEDRQFGDMLLDISAQQSGAMNGPDAEETMRKIFYCPSNYISSASANQWGGINVGVGLGFRTHSYAYFNPRRLPGTEAGTVWDNLDQKLLPAPAHSPLKYISKWSATGFASQTEFAEDLLYAVAPPSLLPDLSNVNWISPASASPNGTPNADDGSIAVNHRTSGTNRGPAGANVLCCDGHAEWRPYSMRLHWSAVSNFPSGNLFWFYLDP